MTSKKMNSLVSESSLLVPLVETASFQHLMDMIDEVGEERKRSEAESEADALELMDLLD